MHLSRVALYLVASSLQAVPAVMQAAAVQAQLQFAREYTLSAEDINRIVRDRKAKGLVKKPLNAQRAELILERQAAQERGDEKAISRFVVCKQCCRSKWNGVADFLVSAVLDAVTYELVVHLTACGCLFECVCLFDFLSCNSSERVC